VEDHPGNIHSLASAQQNRTNLVYRTKHTVDGLFHIAGML